MKINRNAVITDPKGRAFNEGMGLWVVPEPGKAVVDGGDKMTLGFICYAALNTGLMDEKKYSVVQERHALIRKLYSDGGADEVEVSTKEAALLQDLLAGMVGRGLGAWVAGQAGSMLEAKAAPPVAEVAEVAKAA